MERRIILKNILGLPVLIPALPDIFANILEEPTMKKIIYRSESRGRADHGWLKTYHSFSFANYYDEEKVQFGLLRVLNDDYIAPAMGFGKHPHDNMEIITIPLKGSLEHQDSMGNQSVIRPGEVQIMSAGTGVRHSEYNHSREEDVQLFQIWVFPKKRNIEPRYDQRLFSEEEKKNKFLAVVSPDPEDKALWINQDAYFSMSNMDKDLNLPYALRKSGQGVFVMVIEGNIEVAGENLRRRDAVGIWDTDKIEIKALEDSKVLLLEVPMK